MKRRTAKIRSEAPYVIYLLRADRKPKERSIITTFPAGTPTDFIRGWADAKGYHITDIK